MYPLVSCIMPTRNRREFVPGAVECFLSQDWPNKELVVIDDGEDKTEDLLPVGTAYFPLGKVYSIGYKRNLACEAARGEYIIHWDDDDWSGPQRISEQVRFLIQSGAPATGYNYLPFASDELRRAWVYHGSQNYACGTSLCYLRAVWRGRRFPDIQIGEDNAFVDSLEGRLISNSLGSIVARVHSSGTSGSEDPNNAGGSISRLELLVSQSWTGESGQVWQEIDYAQLAGCGYPVKLYDEVTRQAKRNTGDALHGRSGVRSTRRSRTSVSSIA